MFSNFSESEQESCKKQERSQSLKNVTPLISETKICCYKAQEVVSEVGCGLNAPKSPNIITSTFFNTIHLLPKDIRFEHGGAKLTYCPGRHLTSLRPCNQVHKQLIF